MAVSLTVTDLQDGTGVTVTVAGGAVGATNVVSRQALLGGDWVTALTRTGNGTNTPVVAPPGLHWWKCESTSGAATVLANVVTAGATKSADAVHERILQSIVDLVAALDLDGIADIRRAKIPLKLKVKEFPAVVVTPFGKPEAMDGGTNSYDDLGYPVAVIFVGRKPQDDETAGQILLWRQTVSRSFRGQRLAGVPECMTVEIEPDPVFDWDEALVEYEFSALTLRVKTREVRGFGA